MQEYQLYINGDWRPGSAGAADADSPSSGRVFASVALGDASDVDAAVAAAAAAWPGWARSSAFDRAAWCERIVAGIGQRREELARVLTLDQGKPLAAEAYDEVDELAAYFRMAGEDAKRLDRSMPPSVSAGRPQDSAWQRASAAAPS
jgi:acyl-CoA reductase-like NAD-dependent aldehyde dehydrogenase